MDEVKRKEEGWRRVYRVEDRRGERRGRKTRKEEVKR